MNYVRRPRADRDVGRLAFDSRGRKAEKLDRLRGPTPALELSTRIQG
eukprot:CAMPEP_0176212906 /NCGR_PEP_ID=MMETSP0121_2-20121125/15388_1 /TAXON_ID=160619 /ORGANISM="Kryptoperidinium foliaceum, Strain CCMP 1326" /LENGTH=46 /DNA_ID= /DNA_START= /DNA_END= /DNA_ORIENTATION=